MKNLLFIMFLIFIGCDEFEQPSADKESQQKTELQMQEANRQSAIKYYKEYLLASDEEKESIKNIISIDFANFDKEKYLNGEIKQFIHDCKYK